MKDNAWRLTAQIVLVGLSIVCICGCAKGKDAGSITTRERNSAVFELTDVDLLSLKSWNSENVTILGVRLGLSRQQALTELRRRGLILMNADLRSSCIAEDCVVCDVSYVCPGVSLSFGDQNRVSRITVEKVPKEAVQSVRKAAITRKFKGTTYRLVNEYSNNLRLQLLGNDCRTELDQSSPQHQSFRYSKLGLILTVNKSPFSAEKDADVAVTFEAPGP